MSEKPAYELNQPAHKLANQVIRRLEDYLHENDVKVQIGNDGRVIVEDLIDLFNEELSRMDQLNGVLELKNRELVNRALKAETEWSTFRHLTEQAREIIERDHQINERLVESVEAPPSVKRFIQRSDDALKRAAPD